MRLLSLIGSLNVLAVIVCCANPDVAKGEEPDAMTSGIATPSRWHVSAGLLYRRLDNVRIRPGNYSAETMTPHHASDGISGPRASVGSIDDAADRRYADGFVNRDAGTELDGDTWYWGYQDAGQVSGDTLRFHAADGVATATRRSVSVDDSAADGAEDGAGLAVEAGYAANPGARLVYGVNVGLMWARFDAECEQTTFRLDESWSRHRRTLFDTYDLQGMVPPAAPYAGTLDGPGALLPNSPASRTESRVRSGGGRYQAWNRVSESVDIDLWTLSLAPSVTFAAGRFSAQGQAGPALNLMQIRTERSETLMDGSNRSLASWHDVSTDTSILGGLFVKAGAAWLLGSHSSLDIGFRYDWMADRQHDVGPSSVTVNPEGLSATAAYTRHW